MVKLKLREDVKAWLNARPKATRQQDAVTLATRAALRVLPNVYRKEATDTDKQFVFIRHAFRALAAARLFALVPSHAALSGARSASLSSALSGSASGSGSAAYYADFAAICAADCVAGSDSGSVNFAADSADVASLSVYFANFSNNASNYAVWSGISRDATAIEELGTKAILLAPVPFLAWSYEGLSVSMASRWVAMKEFLLAQPTGDWQVWIDWYERIVAGQTSSRAVDEAYVFLDDPTLWDDFAAANAAIKKKLEEVERKGSENFISHLKELDTGTGSKFVLEDEIIKLKSVGDPSDLAAGKTPSALLFHEELLKALPFMLDQAQRADNQLGWAGILQTAQDYATFVKQGLPTLSGEVERFWTLSTKIGSLIDQDNALQGVSGKNMAEPLEPDVRRAILDALRPGALLVRMFPTGQRLDDEYQKWNAQPESHEAAKTIVDDAKDSKILEDSSAKVLNEAAETGQLQGPQAAKSRGWAGRKTKAFVLTGVLASLGTAFVLGYVQQIGSLVAEKSPLARRTADFIARREKEITKLFEGSPPDIQTQIQDAVRRAKELPPVSPLE